MLCVRNSRHLIRFRRKCLHIIAQNSSICYLRYTQADLESKANFKECTHNLPSLSSRPVYIGVSEEGGGGRTATAHDL